MNAMNSGSAFPIVIPGEESCVTEQGLSIRDWFAGQALMGILAFPRRDINNLIICEQSYQIADAMIVERNKQR